MRACVEDTGRPLMPSGCSEAGREQHSALCLGCAENADSCNISQGANTDMTMHALDCTHTLHFHTILP